jgi:hypothetical protein
MRHFILIGASTIGALAACSTGAPSQPQDTGLDGLALTAVNPGSVVPGSLLVLDGRSFVDDDYGASRLHLVGDFDGTPVDLTIPADFVDYGRLEIAWPGGLAAGLPGDGGTFVGDALVEVLSNVDDQLHSSAPLSVTLSVAMQLTPRVDLLQTGVIFVNDPIVVEGDGFLLGGEEGTSFAIVSGCFLPDTGGGCAPVGPREVALVPDSPYDRTRATFAFDPHIAGIFPGTFDGTVEIINRHGPANGEVETDAAPETASYVLVPPQVFSVSPTSASLGQYVEIRGGGFVGVGPDDPDQTSLFTEIELSGTFTPEGAGAMPVNLVLIPEFVSGPMVRYVVSEDDELGTRVDLRAIAGSFDGMIRPVVHSENDSVTGDWTTITLGIAHVKQIVWIHFQPTYVESLRHFGLRAMDSRIRDRVVDVAMRDYAGVNVEFRTEPPNDFALYATVDISGPDPNGLGLLGYDNSPGKDTGNTRLYDKIGGVNATTQEDGFPGYGGVFVESFFGFSEHPGDFAERIDGADPAFDEIFDPFRADRGGSPVLAADLAGGIPVLQDGSSCPATDRPGQIACAVWVLGSMIGTTMTHEVGHSLGLANPDGEGFHDPGDQPNRIMDAGGARTFYERGELFGEGPARFCDDEFVYLQMILPTGQTDPAPSRPSCF